MAWLRRGTQYSREVEVSRQGHWEFHVPSKSHLGKRKSEKVVTEDKRVCMALVVTS